MARHRSFFRAVSYGHRRLESPLGRDHAALDCLAALSGSFADGPEFPPDWLGELMEKEDAAGMGKRGK
jgi:hypothetical protein